MEDEQQREEVWNMAMAYFKRIDELLTATALCQINNDASRWYNVLMSLYKEIYPKMLPEEKTKAVELKDEMTKAKYDKRNINRHSMPTQTLLEFELYLRQLLEDKKMLTPKTDDPSKSYRS